MDHLSKKCLQVRKDPIDLRDLYYEGSLLELPHSIDNRSKIPFIRDQGNEGSCTGFGLAAVVNYLLHNSEGGTLSNVNNSASPRMLYEMAKRYDEWKGEDYEGSSIRGAMKGWYKHGVCREEVWRYEEEENKHNLTGPRMLDAIKHPLGNYFRVRHLHLSHMHSAIREANILYASAAVHSGWSMSRIDPETWIIPFRHDKKGGHAFAIVGYNDQGFWIQNSWGTEWGKNGCAMLTYDDWLENGYDCWVARMGVPTCSTILDTGPNVLGRVLTFDYLPHQAVVESEIRPHLINIGSQGQLSDSGHYQTSKKDVKEVICTNFVNKTSTWKGVPKLLLYAHGGLNNEKASAARIASLKPYFMENKVYPVHFMWETGFGEILWDIIKNAFLSRRFQGLSEGLKERFDDMLDEGIELAVRAPLRPIWDQMKSKACKASESEGGAQYAASILEKHTGEYELHLAGHSAGSIFLAHLIKVLAVKNLSVKTLSLFAPACTTDLFKAYILPHVGKEKCVKQIVVFNLEDKTEQDDTVGDIYKKSLLYMISEALESKRHAPLLGMDKYIQKDRVLKQFFGTPVNQGQRMPTVLYSKPRLTVPLRSASTKHGDFDNDEATLNSVMRIICGRTKLKKSLNEPKLVKNK